MMATEGWKYFSIQDLNELFSIMVKEYPPVEIVEKVYVPPPPVKKEEPKKVTPKVMEKEKAPAKPAVL